MSVKQIQKLYFNQFQLKNNQSFVGGEITKGDNLKGEKLSINILQSNPHLQKRKLPNNVKINGLNLQSYSSINFQDGINLIDSLRDSNHYQKHSLSKLPELNPFQNNVLMGNALQPVYGSSKNRDKGQTAFSKKYYNKRKLQINNIHGSSLQSSSLMKSLRSSKKQRKQSLYPTTRGETFDLTTVTEKLHPYQDTMR